ncbi:MAG: hypothetical protein M1839_003860 [Geoglossum umbratile]|nr:MAG: hypothetical protein M1839_003860 [Geoglossum umbratile]
MVVVPPPPYSPRRRDPNQQQSPQASAVSPAQNISPAVNTPQYNTPISAASSSPPAPPTLYRIQTSLPAQERSPHPPPAAAAAAAAATAPTAAAAPYFPPPPPGSIERRQRNPSKTRVERPQTLFGLSAFAGRKPSNSPAPAATSSRTSVIAPDNMSRGHVMGNNLAAPVAYDTGRRYGGMNTRFEDSDTNSVLLSCRGSIALSPISPGIPPVDPMPPPPPGPPPQWRPPAARRAASTGAIEHMSPGTSRSQSRSPASGAWGPGMPLPPPPRAPPPNSRSQSMTRTPTDGSSSSRGSFSNPTTVMPTRRPLAQESSLPTIPPTPAGWVDEDAIQRGRPSNLAGRGLRVDTSQVASRTSSTGYDEDFTASAATASAESASSAVSAAPSFESRHGREDPPSGGLTRARATRDPSAKGIRERRVESRISRVLSAETSSAIEPNNNPWRDSMEPEPMVMPADIVIPAGLGCGVQRRRTITKSTPRSANTPGSSKTPNSPGNAESEHSRSTTPRPESSRFAGMGSPIAATPPFSPGHKAPIFPKEADGSQPTLPPKALPTPPLQQRHDLFVSTTSLELPAPASTRPVSHLLHIPNPSAVELQPLSPVRPSSRTGSLKDPKSRPSSYGDAQTPTGDVDVFVHAAIERHNSFTKREAAAKSDRERVELFAEFIVGESRIRRERYAAAMDSMGSEILELTRDLFKPPAPVRRYNGLSPTESKGSDWPRNSPQVVSSHRGSLSGAVHSPYPLSPRTVHPPPNPLDLPVSNIGSNSQTRPETAWWGQYMPSLSPIPSVSISDMPDEMSSRGRPPSRWWEASQEGSVGHGSGGFERSRRESKYMGVPREARESLQWESEGRSNSSSGRGSGKTASGTATQNGWYSANEYPLEKIDTNDLIAPPPPPRPLAPVSSTPSQHRPSSASSDQNKLDISRLITLPPPHPRHHPAVNNNHPDLTAIRTIARSLGDFTEIQAARDAYAVKSEQLQEEAQKESRRRNSLLRGDIQRKIGAGSMSYSEAARLEAEFETEEGERKKQRAQTEFDRFQSEVVKVLNAILLQRITTATASFDQLRSKLFVDAQEGSPNMTQEEGDEQPELLEKLTLLKWLFEVREALHREVYELLSERNEKYKVMVLTPYRLSGKEDKIREAEAFFQKDSQDRKVAFEKETLKRVEDFMDVIEQNVVRGVEVQLSAFWDIAPPLLDLIKKIPQDLHVAMGGFGGFSIQIPQSEYDENPIYHSHPLQYLYSLLCHAEKSTYQFIESQTNLLCLLHEGKSAVATANCRCLESGCDMSESVVEQLRGEEEKRLTDDLKEKVATVEEQWQEALGRTLEGVKERVKGVLVREGGWEGVEDEEGFVGGGD